MGWYDGTDGGNLITENTTLTEAENKTLYALWEHDTFVSGITRSISVKDKFIFGNDIPGMSKEELTAQFSNTNISVSMSTGRMSTGTTLNLVDDLGEVYDTLTVIVFGDVNGDGWYDGMDAVTVNCLANGMLSRNDVTAAQYFAADCNCDGAIDSFDVEILKEAGILLADVDQSKSNGELLETSSAYAEYLKLIDQSIETGTAETAEDTPTEEPAQINWFRMILSLFSALIDFIFCLL